MEFEQVVEQMQPKIPMLLNQLHIYRDHEEYTQIALIALWKAYDSYVEGKYEFYAYCYLQMHYDVVDALRKEAKRLERFTVVEETKLIKLADRENEFVELSEIVEKMFENLSKEEKILLNMIFFEQCSNKEIADYFQLTIEATRKRKYRLLQKLKKGKEREAKWKLT